MGVLTGEFGQLTKFVQFCILRVRFADLEAILVDL
jgi:hypothetical protein